jgi:chromosome segregation protein
MYLKSLEIAGFKSFAKKSPLEFSSPISAIVGPNGSGKSNIAEAFRFVLGEQSIKSMRGKKGEDLIFNGSHEGGRANRASVKVTFDNAKRILPVDFDEVSIERVVHRDGINEYLINGSGVRLKDVIELLASAHIGASGHHIISQGEADKILNSNLRDRRSMIEDALGLKIYQYKKDESNKKLEKTEENIKEAESLRREIAPHIKFLKKQVEKIEKALEMKQNLIALYKEYFKRESVYLKHERKSIDDEKSIPQQELDALSKELSEMKRVVENSVDTTSRSPELIALEGKLSHIRNEKDATTRELGKIEGELAYLKRSIEKRNEELSREKTRTVYLSQVEDLYQEIDGKVREAEMTEDVGALRSLFGKVRSLLSDFISKNKDQNDHQENTEYEKEMETLSHDKHSFEKKLLEIKHGEATLSHDYNKIKEEIEKGKDQNVEAEKAILKIMTRQNELHGKLSHLQAREEKLVIEEEDFKRELQDAMLLAGREAVNYDHFVLETVGEERHMQVERKRSLERIKIRLEEAGVGGSEDVMKEYKEAEERDAFLAKELEDLHSSALSLTQLIDELDEKLNTEFREGVRKINDQFNTFFALMFGGGDASLKVVRPEVRKKKTLEEEVGETEVPEVEETEEGLDIEVSLPRKKIKGLVMLSGGERALTSIALLFAISQVNPPPFIILDETDAALDEANSRKYGDMVENLSKHSQLIVITHNRETMSRAGILYGVTMGSDGISKLLSIAFDQAVQVAK